MIAVPFSSGFACFLSEALRGKAADDLLVAVPFSSGFACFRIDIIPVDYKNYLVLPFPFHRVLLVFALIYPQLQQKLVTSCRSLFIGFCLFSLKNTGGNPRPCSCCCRSLFIGFCLFSREKRCRCVSSAMQVAVPFSSGFVCFHPPALFEVTEVVLWLPFPFHRVLFVFRLLVVAVSLH